MTATVISIIIITVIIVIIITIVIVTETNSVIPSSGHRREPSPEY